MLGPVSGLRKCIACAVRWYSVKLAGDVLAIESASWQSIAVSCLRNSVNTKNCCNVVKNSTVKKAQRQVVKI